MLQLLKQDIDFARDDIFFSKGLKLADFRTQIGNARILKKLIMRPESLKKQIKQVAIPLTENLFKHLPKANPDKEKNRLYSILALQLSLLNIMLLNLNDPDKLKIIIKEYEESLNYEQMLVESVF
ncbi:MAG: hypothetical protein AB1571_03850 [Nanoarchaeota archaeon]